jgi:hypothetical protein
MSNTEMRDENANADLDYAAAVRESFRAFSRRTAEAFAAAQSPPWTVRRVGRAWVAEGPPRRPRGRSRGI